MRFFNTRRKLQNIEEALQIIDINQRNFARTYNGTVRLVDETLKKLSEFSAEKRKYEGMTFKAENFFAKPEYGEDWKAEEAELNKKDKK